MLPINWIIMVASGMIMVAALVMIRINLVKIGLAKRTENCKMILHASAFLIYIFVAIIVTLYDYFNDPK